MTFIEDVISIVLPQFNHWLIWIAFLLALGIVVFLYIYQYHKNPKKEFSYSHIGIPLANIISLYIFTKMLEGIIYQESIIKIDQWFNANIGAIYSPGLTKIAVILTGFGSITVISIMCVAALGVLLFLKRWRYALLSAFSVLGALALEIIIKTIVHRPRPLNSLVDVYHDMFPGSFPSGHAIMAIVFASLLIYSFKDDVKNFLIRNVLIVISFSFFVLVGISRIYLNAHWFSDVLGGLSLGLAWFMTVVLIERSITGLRTAIKVETKKAKPLIA